MASGAHVHHAPTHALGDLTTQRLMRRTVAALGGVAALGLPRLFLCGPVPWAAAFATQRPAVQAWPLGHWGQTSWAVTQTAQRI